MNSVLLPKVRQILLVTQLQMIGSFVLALIIFLVEFGPAVVQYIERGSQINAGVTGKTVSEYVLELLRRISAMPHAGDIITVLFWAIAAGLLYAAFVVAANIIISIRNEITVDMNYSKGSVAKVLIKRFGSKILAVCAFAILCAASIFLFVPYWMDMFSIFIFSGLRLDHALFLLVGFFGLFLNIYAVWSAAYFTWVYEESL